MSKKTWITLAAIALFFSGCRAAPRPKLWACVDTTGHYTAGAALGMDYNLSCPPLDKSYITKLSLTTSFDRRMLMKQEKIQRVSVPGYDIGYVLEPGDQYIVAQKEMTAEEAQANGIHNQFDAQKIGIVNQQGKTIVAPNYNRFHSAGCHVVGLSQFSRTNSCLINLQSGKILFNPEQEFGNPYITDFWDCQGGFIPVRIKRGDTFEERFLDKDGNSYRIAYKSWDEAYAAGEGLDRARFGNLWGYIDHETGKIKIKPQYEEVRGFWKHRAAIKKNGLWGLIDHTGTMVVQPQYEEMWAFADENDENKIKVQKHGKWGMINGDGKPLTPLVFDAIMPTNEGLIPVEQNKRWGYINSQGQVIVRPQYLYAYSFKNGTGLVYLDSSSLPVLLNFSRFPMN